MSTTNDNTPNRKESNIELHDRLAREFDDMAARCAGVMREFALARAEWNREQAQRERDLAAQVSRISRIRNIPEWR